MDKGNTADISMIADGLSEAELWLAARFLPKAWEPNGGASHPNVQKWVERGILEIVDGRCGLEVIKAQLVRLTPLGVELCAHLQQEQG